MRDNNNSVQPRGDRYTKFDTITKTGRQNIPDVYQDSLFSLMSADTTMKRAVSRQLLISDITLDPAALPANLHGNDQVKNKYSNIRSTMNK